mmetsp:Transcript_25627/g.64321  ORF Transcript_25627/g.64321 Transcript_25627/m.64321 type:complete len:289 (-) Transcript_25627:216-1082(-)
MMFIAMRTFRASYTRLRMFWSIVLVLLMPTVNSFTSSSATSLYVVCFFSSTFWHTLRLKCRSPLSLALALVRDFLALPPASSSSSSSSRRLAASLLRLLPDDGGSGVLGGMAPPLSTRGLAANSFPGRFKMPVSMRTTVPAFAPAGSVAPDRTPPAVSKPGGVRTCAAEDGDGGCCLPRAGPMAGGAVAGTGVAGCAEEGGGVKARRGAGAAGPLYSLRGISDPSCSRPESLATDSRPSLCTMRKKSSCRVEEVGATTLSQSNGSRMKSCSSIPSNCSNSVLFVLLAI